jgi:hypothetical protein
MATMVMMIFILPKVGIEGDHIVDDELAADNNELAPDTNNGNNDNEDDEASNNSDWSLNSEEAAIFAQVEAEKEAGLI